MSTFRRDFLRSMAGLPAAALGAPPREADMGGAIAADVLVIGGGTAGTIAAIQAGRLGARTVLVEAGSQLGGTTTTAGVDFPGLFHAWGRQVIAGIGWQLVREAVELNHDRLPDFSKAPARHYQQQVRICGALYAALAEEACVAAGVSIRYYQFPLEVEGLPEGYRVTVAGKGVRVRIEAKQLIDCTGNAAVVGMLGLPRRREAETQPGTLIFRLAGYDMGSLDHEALRIAADAEVRAGRLRRDDFCGSLRGFLSGGGENSMHLPGADSSTAETHTATNIAGRASLLRMMRFLADQPGFEQLRIQRLQPEVGVRETYRIEGETSVSAGDYTSGRVFPDAVAYSFYPIDLHVGETVKPEPLQPGIVPTIPMGALIPRGSRNLLAAGRCISSDRLANSALRVQASCMAMGQAAGAAAALAARESASPARVPLERIRRTLEEHGAIVPPLPA